MKLLAILIAAKKPEKMLSDKNCNFADSFKSIKLKRKYLILPLLVFSALLLGGWGSTGHYHISYRSSLSFNQQMEQFNQWAQILADHASDADYRKNTDPDEGPRHYIDIDNYTVFINTGRIPQTLDSVIMIYGNTFVYDQGVLPWATLKTYDSLVACFSREDWDKAVLFAADLGHYVADGHMPLHITRNYNGQYSNNSGIHSRYESTMINAYISQITYLGQPISFVENVNQYVFDYLYTNYEYVDSVLLADDYAKSISGSTNSTAYKQALWEYSQDFTTVLFKNASHALAELIYTAWTEAGSPLINSSAIPESFTQHKLSQLQNTPNPFSGSTQIGFTLKESMDVNLKVINHLGQTVDVIANEKMDAGEHNIMWKPQTDVKGVYFLVLESAHERVVGKMIVQ